MAGRQAESMPIATPGASSHSPRRPLVSASSFGAGGSSLGSGSVGGGAWPQSLPPGRAEDVQRELDRLSEVQSQTSFSSEIEAQEDTLALMVRKLAVLRKGLVEERKLRKKAELQAEELAHTVQQQDLKLQQKAEVMKQVKEKNEQLMRRIADEDAHAASAKGEGANGEARKKSRKDYEVENKRLAAEVLALTERLRSAQLQNQEQGTDHIHHAKQAKAQQHELEERISKLEQQLQEAEDKAQQDQQSVVDMNYALLSERKQLEAQLSEVSANLRAAEKGQLELRATLQAKEEELSHLQQSAEEQKAVLKQMARKLVMYKTKIQTLELPLQRFNVVYLSRLGKTPAELAINKNPQTHTLFLEVVVSGKVQVYTFDDVMQARRVAQSPRRFEIVLSGSKCLRFEADDVDAVLGMLNQFMQQSANHS